MEVKYIRRCLSSKSPMVKAKENGFTLKREPFGKRGSLIELYKDEEMIGYRKSYTSIIRLMQNS